MRGEIGGCPVRVFLDTGVTNPVLAPWIADRFRIPRKSTGRNGVDLAGNVAGLDAIDPVYVPLPSVDLVAPFREVFNGPDVMLGSLGIAAVLPPQIVLARDGVMALDFGASTYRLLPRGATDEIVKRPLTLDTIAKCSGMILVEAKIDGRPATLSIDTGSNVSVLFSESEPGRPLAEGVTKWDRHAGSAFAGAQEEAHVPGVRCSSLDPRRSTPARTSRACVGSANRDFSREPARCGRRRFRHPGHGSADRSLTSTRISARP